MNTVSPGTFVVGLVQGGAGRDARGRRERPADVMRFISEGFGHHIFMGRAADPAEIGPVIAFAASARNTYMTGANINVDGGSDFT